MKRYIRCEASLSSADKANLQHTMKSILLRIWNMDSGLSTGSGVSVKEKTISDYKNSDYSSFAEYVMDHKQDIFPRGDVMMEIDDFASDYKNSYAIRQELLKIYDNYTEKDFARILRLPQDTNSNQSVTSSAREFTNRFTRSFGTLESWCEDLPEKIHTLYLHYADGRIIGKMSVQQAIDTYGEARVTNSYSDGDGQISVWLVE